MSSIGTGYDLSADQFSPDGRIFQVEYAQKAVENSSTAIAIKCKDGVVMAVEKLIVSSLHEDDSNMRIFNVDKHIGIAIAGLLADARHIVEIARDEAANYRMEYGSPIPLKYLTHRVAMYMHQYTLYGAFRPFGASVLLASMTGEPELYMIDPSALVCGYNGCAIGKAKQGAKTEIEKIDFSNITCQQALKEAAKIIYVVHDEVKDKDFDLQLSWVGNDTDKKHTMVPETLQKQAEDYAKQSMEDSDSDED